MLQKSLVTGSDVIIYDLEDSVAPSEGDKTDARERLTEFLTARLLYESVVVADRLCRKRQKVRMNSYAPPASPFA
jgi:citrate lyase beta subunit